MHTQHPKHASRGRHRPAASTKPAHPADTRAGEASGPRTVSDDDIRRSAYQRWEDAGRPAWDGTRFWLEAEQELTRGQ